MAQVILLVADRAMRHSPAFDAARRTAAATGASIHILLIAHSRLVAAAERLLPRQGRLARQGWMAQLNPLLTQDSATLRTTGLTVNAELIWSAHPAEEILLRARALRPILVVMDSAQDMAGQRCERRLLCECPASLWLARGDLEASPARIAIAVDPARPWPTDLVFNQQLLHTGQDLARQSGAECEALYVAHTSSSSAAKPAFVRLAEACGITAGHRHALTGAVVDVLTSYVADHGVNLLVIGGETPPRWKRLVFGNMPGRIYRRIGCDLVVVRPAADAPATHLEPLALLRTA